MTKQVVIFEGISGSGKTTLFTPVHVRRHYEDLQIHRFTATHWVYAQLYGREVSLKELQALEQSLMDAAPTLLVWLRCDPHIAAQRKANLGDSNVEHDMAGADRLFWTYLTRHSQITRRLELWTDRSTVTACVEQIVENLAAHDR